MAEGKRKPMKKPEKGATPRRIGHDMNDPGGPHTPGAKKKRRKKLDNRKARFRRNSNG